ncbi:MAG: TlpA family protein disulfide reductase [Coriobacteriia bacterium]|nr:TlpA family protein disulfide reductase [Coriobacteriia bacterium]
MKNNRNWVMPVVLGVVLVAVLAGALLIYNHFENQSADHANIASTDTTATAETTTTPPGGVGDSGAGSTSGGGVGVPGLASTATESVPDFTLTSANGAPLTLSGFRGLPTIINFWASWCAPCRAELDSFQKMYDRYGNDVNFIMLNVGGQGDTVASVQKFCKDNGYTFPLYFDEGGDATTLFGVTGIPETVFLDAYGRSYGKVIGSMPEATLQRGMALLIKK